jgi:pseudaminic acid cytidylyltransferase
MNIAVIPARGGSKRIPRKNLKSFCGKPMLNYAIEAAISSELFDRVIVSTDDDEITALAKESGAEVPFRRSAKLSNDHAGTLPVIQDAIQRLEEDGSSIEMVSCIYPTVPLLSGKTLRRAGRDFLSNSGGFLIAATAFDYPVQRGFFFSEDTGLQMLFPEEYQTRSQDLKPVFHDAGQFYFAANNTWINSSRMYTENSRLFLLPKDKVCDIDTMEDWEWAELLYQKINADNSITNKS